MTVNSKAKGKRGELDAVKLMRAIGLHARRGVQYCGDVTAPDIVVEELPNVRIEVKSTKTIGLNTQELTDACDQAKREAVYHASNANEQIVDRQGNWCVLWKRTGRGWCLTFNASQPAVRCTVDTADRIKEALLWLNNS
jgi:hypothetical protein